MKNLWFTLGTSLRMGGSAQVISWNMLPEKNSETTEPPTRLQNYLGTILGIRGSAQVISWNMLPEKN